MLPDDEVFLRIWSPRFAHLGMEIPVEVTIVKHPGVSGQAQVESSRRMTESRSGAHRHACQRIALDIRTAFTLQQPISFPDPLRLRKSLCAPVRSDSGAAKSVSISGRIRDQEKDIRIFEFDFRTDRHGLPVADHEQAARRFCRCVTSSWLAAANSFPSRAQIICATYRPESAADGNPPPATTQWPAM